VDVTIEPARDDRAQVGPLDAAWRAATGAEALNESVWIDLAAPQPESAAFFARRNAAALGYVHVARADNAADGTDRWSVGIVVEPSDPHGTAVTAALLDAAIAHVRANGGGTLVLWRTGEHPTDRAVSDAGFALARELYQMRVLLPLDETPVWPAGVTVRMFEPGRDDAAWLAVNNRAFAGHAEQGNWDETTLRRRLDEPWFDRSLFFLAVDGDGVVGFNWCKLHPPAADDPALGEIFVIGVDERARGMKLGRPLALTGLRAMSERGVTTGMLYCAADNAPALRLYRSLGFTVHQVSRAYERTVA
jgi:mycothiol synthase